MKPKTSARLARRLLGCPAQKNEKKYFCFLPNRKCSSEVIIEIANLGFELETLRLAVECLTNSVYRFLFLPFLGT